MGVIVPPNVPVKTGTRHGGLLAPFIIVLQSKTLGGKPVGLHMNKGCFIKLINEKRISIIKRDII